MRQSRNGKEMKKSFSVPISYLCKGHINEFLNFPDLEDILFFVYKYRTYGRGNHLHHQSLSAGMTFVNIVSSQCDLQELNNCLYRVWACWMRCLHEQTFKDWIQALLHIIIMFLCIFYPIMRVACPVCSNILTMHLTYLLCFHTKTPAGHLTVLQVFSQCL